MDKLKMRKGRQRCKVNCSPHCGGTSPNSANIATVKVVELAGHPMFYPIRICQRGADRTASKSTPICRDCAEIWFYRWLWQTPNVTPIEKGWWKNGLPDDRRPIR